MHTIRDVHDNIAKNVMGRLTAVHDEEGHKYRFNDTGEVVRSVTTKLILDRPYLVPWAVKVAFEYMEDKWSAVTPENRAQYLHEAQESPVVIRDDAGNVGHIGHAAIDSYCDTWIKLNLGGTPPKDIRAYIPKDCTDARVYAVARSAEKAFRDFNCVPVATELLVGIHGIAAGTLDMLVMNGQGELELWDWKSSNSVHDSYCYQTAAYKYFFEAMTGLTISRVRIVHLSKEYDKPTMYFFDDTSTAYRIFCKLSEVYDLIQGGTATLSRDVNKQVLDIYGPDTVT